LTSANKTLADSAAEIDALLKNATGTFNGGVFVVGYDASGNVALYYDADANDIGGVTQLVTLTGVGSTATLTAGDFSFIA
jgi:pimeloyl-ACP methyl ester carboxylesterase